MHDQGLHTGYLVVQLAQLRLHVGAMQPGDPRCQPLSDGGGVGHGDRLADGSLLACANGQWHSHAHRIDTPGSHRLVEAGLKVERVLDPLETDCPRPVADEATTPSSSFRA